MSLMLDLFRPAEAPAAVRLRRRLDTLRRDVAALVADLGGGHPPPLVERPPGHRYVPLADPHPSATAAAARPLLVRGLERPTRDALTIELGDPTGAPVRFVPGQFLTLLVPIDGEIHRRAYSICSSIDAPETVAVTVKRVAGGRVSNWLVEHLAVGDILHALGPSGDFTVVPDPEARRSLVAIAGGSGITPILAITRAVLSREPHSRVTLLYGNRAPADIIFRRALAELEARHGERFVVRHVLEQPEGPLPDGESPPAAAPGRLDRPGLGRELDAVADRITGDTHFFVCGPGPAMAAAREELGARAIDAARIHEERFITIERRAHAAPRAAQALTLRISAGPAQAVAAAPSSSATVAPAGAAAGVAPASSLAPAAAGARQTTVETIVPPEATLLDAGLAAGVPMRFSCAMGGCGACAVDLVSGEVEMDEPNCLGPEERARGRVLACVARPKGPCVVEVRR